MRILITTDNYYTKTHAVVNTIANLYRELTKRGHEIRILSFSNDEHKHRDADLYYLKALPMEFVSHGKKDRLEIFDDLASWMPNIIHSHSEFLSYEFALKLSKRCSCPIIHTFHALYEDYISYLNPSKKLNQGIAKLVMKSRLKKADAIIVPTKKAEKKLIACNVREGIEIIPSGINLEKHQKTMTHADREDLRAYFSIASNDIVLVSIGRLSYEKNLDEAIRFFALATEKYPNLKLLLVGEGPARDALERLCQNLEIADKVVFAGKVKPDDVSRYYQAGDIFVSSSTSGTQGLTFIEAAANSLPMLCKKDPILDDIIARGENGYTYEIKEDYLTNLGLMVEEEVWREKAAKKSKEIAAIYDIQCFGDRISNIYNALIGK